MKKMIMLFFFLISGYLLTAQNLRLGIYAGVNNETRTSKTHNFIETGNAVDFRSENSYNYGLIALLKILPSINVNTSFLFTRKKVSTYFSGMADELVNATLYFDYISFAPKLEYNPILGLYINAGPSIDLKINTKFEQSGGLYVENQDEIDGTNDIRLGMLFSLGYRLDFFNRSSIAAELSYDLGISETNSRFGGKYSTTRAALIFYFR